MCLVAVENSWIISGMNVDVEGDLERQLSGRIFCDLLRIYFCSLHVWRKWDSGGLDDLCAHL